MLQQELVWVVECDRCGESETEWYADRQTAIDRFSMLGFRQVLGPDDTLIWVCGECAEDDDEETS